jgi:hypothetical protein
VSGPSGGGGALWCGALAFGLPGVAALGLGLRLAKRFSQDCDLRLDTMTPEAVDDLVLRRLEERRRAVGEPGPATAG